MNINYLTLICMNINYKWASTTSHSTTSHHLIHHLKLHNLTLHHIPPHPHFTLTHSSSSLLLHHRKSPARSVPISLLANDILSVDGEPMIKEKDTGEVYERQKLVKLYASLLEVFTPYKYLHVLDALWGS
jgi:hypothetical protein